MPKDFPLADMTLEASNRLFIDGQWVESSAADPLVLISPDTERCSAPLLEPALMTWTAQWRRRGAPLMKVPGQVCRCPIALPSCIVWWITWKHGRATYALPGAPKWAR